MLVRLDVSRLVSAGADPDCSIDTLEEAWNGGTEESCPRLSGVHTVDDPTSGGPHFFSLDYPSGASRLAYYDYFVSETGAGGDLRVCMLSVSNGRLRPDLRFPAAVGGQSLALAASASTASIGQQTGELTRGPAKPHYGLFHKNRGGSATTKCATAALRSNGSARGWNAT